MIVKAIYKVVRSLIFSVTLFVVGIYVLTYILLSIPPFTNSVKEKAAKELSALMGGKIEIGSLQIFPFNEVSVNDIEVYTPEGDRCVYIETLGAGINLWKLLSERKIEISFGEIIGLNALIEQEEKDSPLNIQFIIDAFKSKDNEKEKKAFELALRNVVLRKSSATFRRPWIDKKVGNLDLSNLHIQDMAADIAFPKISNEGLDVDLRRLSFNMPDILSVERLRFKGGWNSDGINVDDFLLEFPNSRLFISEINLPFQKGEDLSEIIKRKHHTLYITDSYITPSDFSFLNEILSQFTQPLYLDLNAEGNIEKVEIENFSFGNPDVFQLSFTGLAEGLENINNIKGDIEDFNLKIHPSTFSRISTMPHLPKKVKEIINNLGPFEMTGDFTASLSNTSIAGELQLLSDLFTIDFTGNIERTATKFFKGNGELTIGNLHLQDILPEVPIGNINANLIAEGTYKEKDPQGILSVVVEDFEYKGKSFDGFSVTIEKKEELISGDIFVHNAIADIEGAFSGDIENFEKSAFIDMNIENLNLWEIIDMKSYNGYGISGKLNVDSRWNNIDNLTGELSLSNFIFKNEDNTKRLKLNQLRAEAGFLDDVHSLDVKSDWLDIRAEGPYKMKEIPNQLMGLFETIFPALVPAGKYVEKDYTSDLEFDIVFKNNNSLPEFFNLPFRFLVPITINGSIEGSANSASLTLNVPYLQQGKDKLIYDSKIVANIDGESGSLDALIETTLPIKKGDLALNINLFGKSNSLSTDLHFINTENSDFKGHIVLDTEFIKNHLATKPEIRIELKPSILQMGTAEWNIDESILTYSDKRATIKGLRIWHNDQFVEIEGVASPEYADCVKVSLADIDVDYVFDMLQINYVTFGGIATGEVAGHALLSGNPVAETESFVINEFTYNGAPLGTCVATSRWNNDQKEIEISADISQNGKRTVYGAGGIWLGRDSLCFDLEADKVPVEFVQPFMAVFSSHVGGFATGKVKLFGNFHDIDMTGKIFADSVAVKLDYTNTIYHGSDSVFLNPGQIEIPHFMLYDKYGNSALLTGDLKHRYFHDPSFTFRLSEARNFLCYDTSSELNPDWYGTLFGTGSALLRGDPAIVDISADMTVSGNSVFTFVLNDTEYAQDYQFLTFSDKRKEALKQDMPLTAQDYKEMLKKRMHQDEGSLSRFGIDIRATVTPETLFTLVMDPAAGDKITARGRGAMQVKYESDNDEMMMYGKYEIDEGNYNFSLQDIILRDFKIKEGSFISFNGNPLRADLDISATYRVNTNLSDLDKSFSTDRDLNRTNVPVDAVLSVTGNMQSPDITFDIELPTLTQDVERKVKSIISTDDMMNRQIIYLLALNRFYTPEYMGNSGNGGELAAVASSTISSQLSNILGQLTDKFSVSPSFRSDKGDFSDIEVDVALSSKLLNNRLLINGNFGYRDRNNSSTTFVGDFDVEYLLSKNGNLRLKAYNHFNDQNYYLREALTTQGLGLVYRRDFDDWFTFLKKKKKDIAPPEKPEGNVLEKDEGTKNNTTEIGDGSQD